MLQSTQIFYSDIHISIIPNYPFNFLKMSEFVKLVINLPPQSNNMQHSTMFK